MNNLNIDMFLVLLLTVVIIVIFVVFVIIFIFVIVYVIITFYFSPPVAPRKTPPLTRNLRFRERRQDEVGTR